MIHFLNKLPFISPVYLLLLAITCSSHSYDMYLSEDSINSLSFENKKTFLAIILWFGLYRVKS